MTLLEVIVAVAASGVILLSARLLFESIADGAGHLAREVRASDNEANGEALLRDVLRGVERRPADSADTTDLVMEGDERETRFDTRCHVPGGWTAPCRALLRAGRDASTDSFATDEFGLAAAEGLADGLTLTLDVRSVGSVILPIAMSGARSLLYLETAEAGGVWRRRWDATARPPLAIGIVRGEDTLIVRVGGQP